MKNLEVRKGEEAKLFFLETDTVLKEKNLKIYYVTLKNLLKISKDSSLKKAPDPLMNLIGFSLRTSSMEPSKSKKKIRPKTSMERKRKNHPKVSKLLKNKSIYSKRSSLKSSKKESFRKSFKDGVRDSLGTSVVERAKKRRSRLSRHRSINSKKIRIYKSEDGSISQSDSRSLYKSRILSSYRGANKSKGKTKILKAAKSINLGKSYKSTSPAPSLLLRSSLLKNNILSPPKSPNKSPSNSIFSYLPFSKPGSGNSTAHKNHKSKRNALLGHKAIFERRFTSGNVRTSKDYANLIKSHRSNDRSTNSKKIFGKTNDQSKKGLFFKRIQDG